MIISLNNYYTILRDINKKDGKNGKKIPTKNKR